MGFVLLVFFICIPAPQTLRTTDIGCFSSVDIVDGRSLSFFFLNDDMMILLATRMDVAHR